MSLENLDIIFLDIGDYYQWKPNTLYELYLDNEDPFGLFYWYLNIQEKDYYESQKQRELEEKNP